MESGIQSGVGERAKARQDVCECDGLLLVVATIMSKKQMALAGDCAVFKTHRN